MHSDTTNCERCRQPFSYEALLMDGKPFFTPKYCETCEAIIIDEDAQEARKRAEEGSRKSFLASIPPMYRQNDRKRLPFNAVLVVDSWNYGPQGIGFIGKSGAGKTRTAILLLLRMAGECRKTLFLPCTEFCNAAADQFSDDPRTANEASSLLSNARTTDVLLLDDLGKNRMTDRAESSLYELLEYRTSRMKPTIWTSNSNGTQLHAMFSKDRASAILRRLVEFSETHNFAA